MTIRKAWDTVAHSHFYASHKKENRYSYDHLVVIELQSDKQEKVDEEIQDLHDYFRCDDMQ